MVLELWGQKFLGSNVPDYILFPFVDAAIANSLVCAYQGTVVWRPTWIRYDTWVVYKSGCTLLSSFFNILQSRGIGDLTNTTRVNIDMHRAENTKTRKI